MADNLQTKTEKLIKYANEKFGTNESNLRNIIDNAKLGEDLTAPLNEQTTLLSNLEAEINGLPSLPDSDEWQPNADMIWARSVYEAHEKKSDNTALYLLGDLAPSTDIIVPVGGCVYTSDGGYYPNDGTIHTITHTWDDSNAKNSQSYKGIYNKVRWVFRELGQEARPDLISGTVYAIFNMSRYGNFYLHTNCEYLEYFELLNQTGKKPNDGGLRDCISLRDIPKIDLSLNTEYRIDNVPLLKKVPVGISHINKLQLKQTDIEVFDTPMPNLKNVYEMFKNCVHLKKVKNLNTENCENVTYMFQGCTQLTDLQELNTDNNVALNYAFENCRNLRTIILSNLAKTITATNTFRYCEKLTNLTLKNIKVTLQIGSGTSWGHLLTLDSLLNTIKELHDNTSGTSTLTLTVGSANLTKLANVYIKLIDITDEMRAEDEFIDLKKPFEVCESTDEGAMLITEYVTSKNWQLA